MVILYNPYTILFSSFIRDIKMVLTAKNNYVSNLQFLINFDNKNYFSSTICYNHIIIQQFHTTGGAHIQRLPRAALLQVEALGIEALPVPEDSLDDAEQPGLNNPAFRVRRHRIVEAWYFVSILNTMKLFFTLRAI